jgi:hypothetical protein
MNPPEIIMIQFYRRRLKLATRTPSGSTFSNTCRSCHLCRRCPSLTKRSTLCAALGIQQRSSNVAPSSASCLCAALCHQRNRFCHSNHLAQIHPALMITIHTQLLISISDHLHMTRCGITYATLRQKIIKDLGPFLVFDHAHHLKIQLVHTIRELLTKPSSSSFLQRIRAEPDHEFSNS